MKRTVIAACCAFLLLLSPGIARPVTAQQGGPQNYIYLPQINVIGHVYLPIVSSPPQWSGPIGGTITAVVYDPTNGQTVYAASFDGGMYKSTNGGLSWFQINQGLPTVQINMLTIDPTNPSVLYAGPYRYGIYKTLDGGQTWFNAGSGLPDGTIAYSIEVNPANPNTVYIGSRKYISGWGPPWYGGIYKTTDGGQSWKGVFTNIGGSSEQDWVYSLQIDPSTPSTIYAAAHESGMYRSKDSGATWQPIDTGLTDLSTRTVIADPTNTSILYTATWHRAGVYKSLDGGNHWTNYQSGSAGGKFMQLILDPKSTSTLFAVTENLGILKSTSAGTSWFNVASNPTFFYSIAINPWNSSNLLAGSSSLGLWQTTDSGATWSQVKWGFTSTGTFTDLSAFPEYVKEHTVSDNR